MEELSMIKPMPENLHFVLDKTEINGRPPSKSTGEWYADGEYKLESNSILSMFSAGKNCLRADPLVKPSFSTDSVVAFPSLVSSMGFLEFTNEQFKKSSLCPFSFEGSDLRIPYSLGQYGPSIAEDMVLTYENEGKIFVLVAKRPYSKIWTLVGGGMEKSNTSLRQTGARELREEGVKHVPDEFLKEYMFAIKNSKLVYTGIVWDDPRNSGNGWMETKAFVARILKDLAITLKLGTTQDEDGECDVSEPKWMEITEENMEKNNLIQCHRLILRRAIHCMDVRYCNSFEIPWTMRQLERFQTVNLAEVSKGQAIAKYDPYWTRIEEDDPTMILPILGPSGFDRLEFYKHFVSACKDLDKIKKNNIIYWDPMNEKLDKENPALCRAFENNAILHPCAFPIFVIPNDLEPHVTWKEMDLVVKNKKNTIVFVENGTKSTIEEKVPEELKSTIIKYDTLEEIANYIVKSIE